MSSIGSPSPFFFGGAKSYEIERSLRFVSGDSTKLTRTFGTNTSNTTKTVSFWVKRGNVSSSSHQNIFSTTISGMIEGRLFFLTDDRLQFEERDASGGTSDGRRITTQKFRDVSAWYHVVLVLNSTESTEIDRAKIYVNGTQVTAFDQTRDISQNYSFSFFRSSVDNFIGVMNASSEYFDGYLAEINFIDGQALTPASFGETSTTTGQWIPKEYTGTYGNNGFYLKFADNSGTTATTLGKDSSGNDNNFTPTNLSVSAGSGNDSLEDTPTNNFATLNAVDFSGGSLVQGNLRQTNSSSTNTSATFGMQSGKWYWEIYLHTQNQGGVLGIGIGQSTKGTGLGDLPQHYGYSPNGQFYETLNGSITSSSYGATLSAGDIIGVKFDADTRTLEFLKNNASQGTKTVPVLNSHVYLPQNHANNTSYTINFGQRPFNYTAPTGYKTLCSKNLPDPTIKLPNKYFETLLYTGNGGTQSITGLEFQPDWVWLKKRNGSTNNLLYDAVRGATKELSSNLTDPEGTESGSVSSFNSNGFSVGSNGGVNGNSDTFVAWNWNAGGSTATNNDGTITSQVRASTTAGFSIVSYTGNGSNSQTVGHGLGVSPNVVILKDRDSNSVTGRWTTIHSFDTSKNLELNTTSVAFGHQGFGSITALSSTTFTLFGSSNTNTVNESGDDYIAYVFSEVAGYSKFGSYSSNGNSNGTFVFLGFKPALVIFKNTSSTEAWSMFDNKRDPHNPVAKFLRPSGNNTETSGSNDIDFLSNGFKARTSNNPNVGSNTYIYLAFAKASFKFANAR